MPNPRILIVDDNDDHRLILRYQLARIQACEIQEAVDGQQALAAIAATPPDLIFMNLGLPVLDGWEGVRYSLAALCGLCALFSLVIIVEFFVLRRKLPPGSY